MAKVACGFDCGGTNLKCYCNLDGKIITKIVSTGKDFTQLDLVRQVESFVDSIPAKVEAIGFAFGGIGTTTHIHTTPRTYLKDLDANVFAHLDCKIAFINDANAAALCGVYEYPEAKVLVGVTNGTGIGSGICIGGRLFLGANGRAGEITGNILVNGPNGPARAWTVASGSVLSKKLSEVINSSEKEKLINESATFFGLLLTHVINTLNPDVIYLSGGVLQYKNYFEIVERTVKEYGVDYMIEELKLVRTTHDSYAGCIGAIQYVTTI